jgi:hypothetical protein
MRDAGGRGRNPRQNRGLTGMLRQCPSNDCEIFPCPLYPVPCPLSPEATPCR